MRCHSRIFTLCIFAFYNCPISTANYEAKVKENVGGALYMTVTSLIY